MREEEVGDVREARSQVESGVGECASAVPAGGVCWGCVCDVEACGDGSLAFGRDDEPTGRSAGSSDFFGRLESGAPSSGWSVRAHFLWGDGLGSERGPVPYG